MSTIVLVRHEVADYSRWRSGFDVHVKEAHRHGFRTLSVLRDNVNENDVTVIFEAKNLALAKTFLKSEDVLELMKQDGVISKPQISYLTDATRSY